jgi:hypothetical protein
VRGPVAVVRDGEGRAVAPVVEIARDAAVVVEAGDVVEGESVAER